MTTNFNDTLQWRYATKKFDPSKSISDADLEYLKEAMQLSASSFGLQPYQILIIQDKEIREKLLPVSWNQSQIVDASHVVVIASKSDFREELVEQYVSNAIASRGIQREDIEQYAAFMNNSLINLPQEAKATWTAKQAYIVLANLMAAAAHLKIDTCPMEGFEPEKYNDILGLAENNLHATLVVPIGYRSNEDQTQHLAKVRKSKSQLFKTI